MSDECLYGTCSVEESCIGDRCVSRPLHHPGQVSTRSLQLPQVLIQILHALHVHVFLVVGRSMVRKYGVVVRAVLDQPEQSVIIQLFRLVAAS